MLEIRLIESYEYIECISDREGIWHHRAQYRIAPKKRPRLIRLFTNPICSMMQSLLSRIGKDAGELLSGRLASNISVPLSVSWSPDFEVSIKYRLFFSQFEPHEEVPVGEESLIGSTIPLGTVLDLNYVGWLFETRNDFYFPFEVVIRQPVDLDFLRQQNLIQSSTYETDQRRQIRISNRVAPVNQANSDPPLRGYSQTVGNLDHELILEISMFAGSLSVSWQIRIDDINKPFTKESFSSTISQALHSQSRPVLERIPTFLRQAYRESSNCPLEVIVTIPEVNAELEYMIEVTLSDPAGDLYYSTGHPQLDQCIRDIHLTLLDYGIPVGLETEVYQRVLGQLLIYRHSCSAVRGYVDPGIVIMTEIEGFHQHLLQRLAHQLAITPVEIVSEPEIGNSRVDLLIEGIPTELKLEDRITATTDDIVERYQGQAPFGFLMVLDTVLDREQPTSPVDQDYRVTLVPNVSGNASAVVITVVVRIPRPASEHTVLARRRS
jgi:hypothetical protein